MLSQKEILEIFTYNEEEGELYWNKPTSQRAKKGQKAGSLDVNGYRVVTLRYRRYYIHHLIWMIHTGEWPDKDIDHINRVRSDNRIDNLRCVTHQENLWNTDRKGYFYLKSRNKFAVDIRNKKGKVRVGYYDTAEEAREAYLKAKEERNAEIR